MKFVSIASQKKRELPIYSDWENWVTTMIAAKEKNQHYWLAVAGLSLVSGCLLILTHYIFTPFGDAFLLAHLLNVQYCPL